MKDVAPHLESNASADSTNSWRDYTGSMRVTLQEELKAHDEIIANLARQTRTLTCLLTFLGWLALLVLVMVLWTMIERNW